MQGQQETTAAPHRADLAYPLDRDDPRVQAARAAEQRAYEHYGLEPEEHLVDVEPLQTRVRVLEVGSGPPVLAIPGGIGHGVGWLPLLAELEGFTFYVMDRPGGGLSDGIDHRDRPLRSTAALSTHAVVDHLDLDTVPLVANSMGGLWSFRFALEHPDRVSAIAQLGCPALFGGTSAPLPMRLMSLPGVGRLLVEPLMQPDDVEDARDGLAFLGHPEATRERLPEAFAEAVYRIDNLPSFRRSWVSLLQQALTLWGPDPEAAFTTEDLQRIHVPVALVWGSDDPFGSRAEGRAGAEHLPEATFHEVGIGHLPWLDEAKACASVVQTFLTPET